MQLNDGGASLRDAPESGSVFTWRGDRAIRPSAMGVESVHVIQVAVPARGVADVRGMQD